MVHVIRHYPDDLQPRARVIQYPNTVPTIGVRIDKDYHCEHRMTLEEVRELRRVLAEALRQAQAILQEQR